MASSHLSNDEFLTSVKTLFDTRRNKGHGSVCLVQKRMTPPDLPKAATDIPLPPSSPFPDLHPPHPLPILIRATNGKSRVEGKKLKLSTVVSPDDIEQFYARYADIWKAGMSGLKKRDRSGRKAKAKGKKKKGKEEPPAGDAGAKK